MNAEHLIAALQAVDDAVKAGAKRGEIPCPICKTGTIRYIVEKARSGQGQCSTPGCVRWLS